MFTNCKTPEVTSKKGGRVSMNVDERIEALVMSLELLTHDVQDLKIAAQQDGENIRALARIAETHHQRITRLEE